MSLNGLDNPEIKEAHDHAVVEPGGWFLLKYASRDEIELLERGSSGIVEVRNAIAKYEEPSPLFGFLRYRRRNVLIKYVPEGCSRLIQARVTVHFNAVSERFSPHDAIFPFATPAELRDTELSAVCSSHTASGSISSSTSSLRRRKLEEIAEDDEETKKRESLVERNPLEDGTVTEKSAHGASLQASSTADSLTQSSTLPSLLAGTSPITSPSKSELRYLEEPPLSPTASYTERRLSSQSVRPELSSYNSFGSNGRPKVKLGPRPSLDVGGRPHTSGSGQFRPISTLPAGIKLFSKGTRKDKDRSSPLFSGSMPSIVVPPPIPEDTTSILSAQPYSSSERPKTSSGASVYSVASTASTAVRAPTMTPEKARLMKAVELRKRQMQSKSKADAKPKTPAEPVAPEVEGKNQGKSATPVETVPPESELSDLNQHAKADSGDAVDAPSITTTEGSENTRGESMLDSPLGESENTSSTTASSVSESTDETIVETDRSKEKIELPAADKAINNDRDASEIQPAIPLVPVEGSLPEAADEAEAPTDVAQTESLPTISVVAEDAQPNGVHAEEISTEGLHLPHGTAIEPEVEGMQKDDTRMEDPSVGNGHDDTPRQPVSLDAAVLETTNDGNTESKSEASLPSTAKTDVSRSVAEQSSAEIDSDVPENSHIELTGSPKTPVTATATESQVESALTMQPFEPSKIDIEESPKQTVESEVSDQHVGKSLSKTCSPELKSATAENDPMIADNSLETTNQWKIPRSKFSLHNLKAASEEMAPMPQPSSSLPISAPTESPRDSTHSTDTKQSADENGVEIFQPLKNVRKRHTTIEPIKTDISTTDVSDNDFLSDDDLMGELQTATVMEAKPFIVSKSSSPTSAQLSPGAGAVRVFSNPSRNASGQLLSAPELQQIDSTRSVSGSLSASAYINRVNQQNTQPLAAKKVNLGSGISQRIKALEQLSTTNAASSPGSGSTSPGVTSSFFAVRKPSVRVPSQTLSISERTNSLTKKTPSPSHSGKSSPELYRYRSRSGSSQSRLDVLNTSPINAAAQKPRQETISVTAKIVREPQMSLHLHPQPDPSFSEFSPLDLKQSPLIIDHQRPSDIQSKEPAKPVETLRERRLSNASIKTAKEGRSSLDLIRDFVADRRTSFTSERRRSSQIELPASSSRERLASPARPPSTHWSFRLGGRPQSIVSARSLSSQDLTGGGGGGVPTFSSSPPPTIHDTSASASASVSDDAASISPPEDAPDGRKRSRTSRVLRRMSSSLSAGRKTITQALSPVLREDLERAAASPAAYPAAMLGASPHSRSPSRADAAARRSPAQAANAPGAAQHLHQQRSQNQSQNKQLRAPEAVVSTLGDVNVQFPDTLLWKRRHGKLDDATGFLILSPVQGSSDLGGLNKGLAIKRYFMGDFGAPYVPDVEVQELPNSVCLDFRAGSQGEGAMLQMACEGREGQAMVLAVLRDAHKQWSAAV